MRIRYLLIIGIVTAVALCAGCGPYSPTGSNALPLATAKPSPIKQSGPNLHLQPDHSYERSDTYSAEWFREASHRRAGTSARRYDLRDSNQFLRPGHLFSKSPDELHRNPLAGAGTFSQTVNLCKLMIPTAFYALDVGQNLAGSLVAPPHGWMPGLYVAALSYSTSLSSLQTTISSEEFQVT